MDELKTLRAMAERLTDNPEFMAHVLDLCKREEGLDDFGLASKLQTFPNMLVRLALCRRPNANSADFSAQLSELSDYTMIEERLLVQLLQKADKALSIGPDLDRSRILVPGSVLRWFDRPSAIVGLSCAFLIVLTAGFLVWQGLARRAPVPGPPAAESPGAANQDSPVRDKATEARTGDSAMAGGVESTAESEPPPLNGARKPGTLAARAEVAIDFESRSEVRDLGVATAKSSITLPPERARFVLKLPKGSRSGTFIVTLKDAFAKVLDRKRAVSTDGRRLRFVMDLRSLAGKNVYLCVERRNELPDCNPVFVSGDGK